MPITDAQLTACASRVTTLRHYRVYGTRTPSSGMTSVCCRKLGHRPRISRIGKSMPRLLLPGLGNNRKMIGELNTNVGNCLPEREVMSSCVYRHSVELSRQAFSHVIEMNNIYTHLYIHHQDGIVQLT